MEVYKPKQATEVQLQQFHSEDYVDFLRRINPDNMKQFGNAMQKYNMGEYTDCPVFDGVYDFCSTYSGKLYLTIFLDCHFNEYSPFFQDVRWMVQLS